MLNPRELRIGNWLTRDSGLFKIAPDSFLDVFDGWYNSGEPIPLTEEWLVKFGFKEHNGSYVLNDIYIFKTTEGWVYEDFGAGKALSKPFLFVHKLQNLYFALEGEELSPEGL